jgi:MscS family membrane protein
MLYWIALIASALAAAGQVPTGSAAPGPAEPQTTDQKPQDPLNRASPQSSILAFLDACHSQNYQRAVHYLDLSQMPAASRMTQGVKLAQQLEDILNRDAQFDVAALSHDPAGESQDGLNPDRDVLATLELDKKTVQLELERKKLRSGILVWRVAADSLALIPELAAGTSESPIERHLPPPLVNYKLLDTAIWRWLALTILAIGVGSLSRMVSRWILSGLTPFLKRIAPRVNWELMQSLLSPVQLLLCAAAFGAGMQWVDPSAVLRLYLQRTVELLSVLGVVWLVARVLDLGMARVRAALDGSQYQISRSALPLAARVLKIVFLVLGVVGLLSSWGYNTTALLTGLGIGGVAIALAAQKTIENLFGSVAVISDRPVVVGDVCKFGDNMGTVEDIGLRSTRIRTADRTLVTIPNGQFSSMTLENLSRKDKMLFHITLNLRRDTTPDQVRKVLRDIREILKDPSIETGAIPVRFVGVGEYSLNVEIYAYIRTEDGDEFLKVQQELLLRILDAVAAAGTALALPTQASVQYAIDRKAPPAEPNPPAISSAGT